MKKQANHKQLEYLLLVSNSSELREEIERVIEETDTRHKERNTTGLLIHIMEPARNSLAKAVEELSEKYGVEKEPINLYISMDEKISYITRSKMKYTLESVLFFSDTNARIPEMIHGGNLEEIYSSGDYDLMDFFEENTRLFSESTQKRLSDLKTQHSIRPEISKILNEFEMKVYAITLKDKFDAEQSKAHFTHFSWIENSYEQIQSIYHLWKAIWTKYPPEERRGFWETERMIILRFQRLLLRIFPDETGDQIKKAFIEILARDETFKEELLAKLDKEIINKTLKTLINGIEKEKE